MFEDEHPLAEREGATGKRNIIVYHTAGKEIKAIKELTSDINSDIYTFNKI